MVKRHIPPETGETVCPACGGAIKIPPSARRRRVQCPKCREVVFLEGSPEKPNPHEAAAAPSRAPEPTVEERSRIDLLEARVEALEAALRDSMTASRAPDNSSKAPRKLLWVTSPPGLSPDFSAEQGQALFHNLGSVRNQAITIRTPAADSAAREHAEWFKAIFERAGWTVRGPEEIKADAAVMGFSLAVPELPVAKEAATAYMALKAAGFEPIPVLDSALARDATAMSLTLPPGKAA